MASNTAQVITGVHFSSNAYEAATDADAIVLVTEWNEFGDLDLARLREVMQHPLIVDGRNLYDPVRTAEFGFEYIGVARGEHLSSLAQVEQGILQFIGSPTTYILAQSEPA